MYPNVTGQATDRNYEVSSPDTNTTKIGTPILKILDCPRSTTTDGDNVRDNYVLEGTTTSCSCSAADDASYFPADVSFSVSMSHDNAFGGLETKTVVFKAQRNQELVCQAVNSLYLRNKVTRRLQVAYGPSKVDLHIQNPSGPVELCGNTEVIITVLCEIPGMAMPRATFVFSDQSDMSVSLVPQSLVSQSGGQVNITASEGGHSQISCTALNYLFPDKLLATGNISIEVLEPPSVPVLDIDHSSGQVIIDDVRATVKEGVATVRCLVKGGYPQPTKWELRCGSVRNVTNRPAQITVNLTRDMSNTSCTCTVTHLASCYQQNSTYLLLAVLDPTKILFFTVDPNSNLSTVKEDSKVAFTCEAEGNPGPNLSLYKRSLGTDKELTFSESNSLRFNKRMACEDTGVYVCRASTQARWSEKMITLSVLCPQQLDHSVVQHHVYRGQKNDHLTIIVSVFGYPAPSALTLTGDKTQLESNDFEMNYISQEPPHGTVEIKFVQLQEKFFQNYTLNVTNTQGSLAYHFYLQKTDVNSDSGLEVGAIAGIVVAAVAIVIIIIVILSMVFLRRKEIGSMSGRKEDGNPAITQQCAVL